MKHIKISAKAGRTLSSNDVRTPAEWGAAQNEIRRALAALDRRKVKASPRLKAKRMVRAEKNAETAELWADAKERSGGDCECGCGRSFAEEGENKPELDHQRGRGRARQTLQNVWLITAFCHREKHRSRPSRLFWLETFRQHAMKHEYLAEALRVESEMASFSEVKP